MKKWRGRKGGEEKRGGRREVRGGGGLFVCKPFYEEEIVGRSREEEGKRKEGRRKGRGRGNR